MALTSGCDPTPEVGGEGSFGSQRNRSVVLSELVQVFHAMSSVVARWSTCLVCEAAQPHVGGSVYLHCIVFCIGR